MDVICFDGSPLIDLIVAEDGIPSIAHTDIEHAVVGIGWGRVRIECNMAPDMIMQRMRNSQQFAPARVINSVRICGIDSPFCNDIVMSCGRQ